jgi:transcription elongation factor Elf1
MTGTCPKCDHAVSTITVGHVRMSTGLEAKRAFHGVSYMCPFCNTVLGVGVDVDALRADIVDDIVKLLREMDSK